MEEVMYARGREPWRREFTYMQELRDEGWAKGVEQGRAEQLAADQAEIAKLKAENARLRKQLT